MAKFQAYVYLKFDLSHTVIRTYEQPNPTIRETTKVLGQDVSLALPTEATWTQWTGYWPAFGTFYPKLVWTSSQPVPGPPKFYILNWNITDHSFDAPTRELGPRVEWFEKQYPEDPIKRQVGYYDYVWDERAVQLDQIFDDAANTVNFNALKAKQDLAVKAGDDYSQFGKGDDTVYLPTKAAKIRDLDPNEVPSWFGQDGADTITLSDLRSAVYGGNNPDTFKATIAQLEVGHTISGDQGHDKLVIKTPGSIASGPQQLSLSGIEEIVLANGYNKLDLYGILQGNANSMVVTITGGNARDEVNGQAASQRLKLLGERGNDSLTGGAHGDRIEDGSGRDRLEGGPGNDIITLTDDGMVDTIVYERKHGGDIIWGFNPGQDNINLSYQYNLTWAKLQPLIRDEDGGAVIYLNSAGFRGDAIWLKGIEKQLLDSGDFIFQRQPNTAAESDFLI